MTPDPEIAQRRASDPRASVWVAASAGSGKTKVLTDRVIALLLDGTPAHRILCITFTKAAAAEMANRIAQRLGAWATAPEATLAGELRRLLGRPAGDETVIRARRLFAQVLDAPDGMRIQTIHSFCQSLLRRFPLEAGLAPHFQVMDDRSAEEAMAAAREEVLASARDGAPELAEALAEVVGHVAEQAFPELMAELARERGRLRRMVEGDGGLAGAVARMRAHLGLAAGETADGILAAACEDSAFDAAACRAALAVLQGGGKTDLDRAALVGAWLSGDGPARAAGFRAYCRAFHTDKEEIRARLVSKATLAAEPALRAEAERLLVVLARWRAARVAQATAALLRLAAALLSAYERHKAGRALLDYDDLILAASDLLAGGAGRAAWVLYKLDGGLDHVLIDEAQDTNPDQWSVIESLTGEFFAGSGAAARLRTVFAVGDAKQSIYSFQRADPREFERVREGLAARVPAAGNRFETVGLHVSFRSTRAVLDAVDAVFATPEGGDGVVAPGEDLRHRPFREGQAGLVELWPPVAPRPRDESEAWKPPIERVRGDSPRQRLARLVARRIGAMVGTERLASRDRPVRAGDIMVLVRRRNAFVEDLVRELKSLDVEVAGTDRMILTEQMAVMDLLALGRFVLQPDDDLTLACVLKGPLIGFDEQRLFDLAHRRGERSLWEALKAGRGPAFDELADLLALADRIRPHEFFAHVLGARGGRAKLLRRLGPEAEDAIDEFMALTLAHERAHAPSLQGLLRWLDCGGVEIKRDLEQARDAVRIMTVHGAKGLQAPVVFLPDTMQAPAQTPRLLWPGRVMLWVPRAALLDPVSRTARDQARRARDQEYRRLLYVAMTRAEDRLIVCGWETRTAPPDQCWHHLVGRALAPQAREVEDDFLARHAETRSAVALHLASPQTAPPSPDGAPPDPATAAGPLPAWVTAPPPEEPAPPRPLVPSRPEDEEPPVRSPLGADDGARFRRGRIVHRLLESLPAVPPSRRAAAMARFLARPAFGLPAAEQVALAAEVARVLEDHDFAPIFGPGSQAEVPLVGRIGERIVSGQVDRLLVTPDAVLVIDYKTNRPPPLRPAEVPRLYLRQMAAYRAALACVYPGRPVRCALLWTDGPRLMPLDGRLLDDLL